MNVIEKRTSETLWCSIDCTDALDAAETIQTISSIAADQGSLAFSGQVVNSAQVAFSDGRTASVGKVIQVQVAAGTIPAASTLQDGRAGLQCTIRAKYVTNEANTREATVLLNLTDKAA